jgi:hypothetical protein
MITRNSPMRRDLKKQKHDHDSVDSALDYRLEMKAKGAAKEHEFRVTLALKKTNKLPKRPSTGEFVLPTKSTDTEGIKNGEFVLEELVPIHFLTRE